MHHGSVMTSDDLTVFQAILLPGKDAAPGKDAPKADAPKTAPKS